MVSDRTILPDDVLALIFRDLEPCFLIKVMLASKQLNKAASADTIFFDKMRRYFPNESMQTTNVPRDVTYKAKYLFKDLYAARFATLRSSASRRLLSFIIEEDVEKIRQFDIDGNKLFAMLEDKDVDGKDMFFYANRAHNPAVRQELMNLYLRPFVAAEHSWNPLKLISHHARKKFYETELGHLLNSSTSAGQIYDMAAAFGEVECLKGIENEYKLNRVTFMSALRRAAQFGHIQATEYLLSLSDNFEVAGEYDQIYLPSLADTYPYNHPVGAAVMNDQPEMVRLLLLSDKISSHADTSWRHALSVALKFRHVKVLAVLIDVLSNEKYQNISPKTLLSEALRDSAQYDYVELVDLILQKVFDNSAVMTNKDRAASFNDHGSGCLEIAIGRAIKHGSVRSLELFLTRYDKLMQGGFIKSDSPYDPLPEVRWWRMALSIGSVEMVNILLKHEYFLDESTIREFERNHPAIADTLMHVLQKRREADSVSTMRPM